MNYDVFANGIEEIFAIFGKKMPEERAVGIVYKRVKELPPEFMNFAVRHFEDQESLPRNLGRYLYRELWPQYLERHPDLKSKTERVCCPLCSSIPGWRNVWKPETLGWGEKSFKIVQVRCICGNAPNPRDEPIYTDSELEARGFLLTSPYPPIEKRDFYLTWLKRYGVGLEPEIRPAHKKYLEENENIVF